MTRRAFAYPRAREPEPLAAINITPLIDVMLVLLIMTIPSIPAMTDKVPIDLPRQGPAVPLDKQVAHVIDLDQAVVLARALIAWSQLFGMISFELFGQFVGSVDPTDEFFGYAVERMADLVGLPR